jgi:arsenical pump membrane protein
MAQPWLVACAGEWLALRTRFAAQLAGRPYAPRAPSPAAPRYALAVVVVTVLAMVSLSSADVAVAWAALGGCVLLLVPRFARRDVRPLALVKEASPGFCAFVLALAVLVDAVVRHGLGDALTDLVPSGTSLPALLGLVLLAAAAANLVNNLPATLALVPIVAGSPAAVLAVLIGVNVGPNATYGGSLATLLWRRMLPERDRPAAREFHLFGLWSVPLVLLGCTVALWISARVVPSG